MDGWQVDPKLVREVDRDLRASFAKGGDPDVRKALIARSHDLFPVIADRLRADVEAIAKEAAAVANLMFKENDIRLGDGGEFIPDAAFMNDAGFRFARFQEMRMAWNLVQEKMREGGRGPAAGPAGGGGAADGSFAGMVDMLRHGGEDRDQAIQNMRANKPYFVRELIKSLTTDDVIAGRACANALNELTGASLPVPELSAYDGAALTEKWYDWLLNNADKL